MFCEAVVLVVIVFEEGVLLVLSFFVEFLKVRCFLIEERGDDFD